MKCDNLVKYGMDDPTIDDDYEMYRVADVDAAIAELKRENQWLKNKMDDYHLMSDIRRAKIKELKRSLWLARSSEAKKEVNYWTCQDESSYAIVDFNVRHETIVSYKAPHQRPYKWILIWENVERKCLAKAEAYK